MQSRPAAVPSDSVTHTPPLWDGCGPVVQGRGDVLVGMDDLNLRTKKPGDIVKVRYRRDGVLESVLVTLSSRGAR